MAAFVLALAVSIPLYVIVRRVSSIRAAFAVPVPPPPPIRSLSYNHIF
jgi:hypothetical protein